MTEPTHESRAVTRTVSDDDREQTVKRLTAAFAEDAIAVDEFERRVAAVYRARSTEALAEVTRDLPAPAESTPPPPAPTDHPTSLARRPLQKVGSILSQVERQVQGPMPECLDLRSVVGSMDVDLRRADFPPGVTEIRVEAILGNIEIELPETVHVEDEGHAFLGTFSVRGRSRATRDASTPVVRITGRSILAKVEIELDD